MGGVLFMGKDSLTITLGAIYDTCIVITWLLLYMPFDYCVGGGSCYSRTYISGGAGMVTYFGLLVLIPSFILMTVFIASSDSTTTWQAGFGIGVFGWLLILSGAVNNLIYYTNIHYLTILMLILPSILIATGVLCFARIWKFKDFTRDQSKFISGLINISLIVVIQLLFNMAFLNILVIPVILFYFGLIIFIPVFILNTVFFASSESDTSGTVGFIFGIFAWLLCVAGSIMALTSSHPSVDVGAATIGLILTILIVVSGSFLYSRINKVDGYIPEVIRRTRRPSVIRRTSYPAVRTLSNAPGPPCPECHRNTTYIAQYERFYCYNCGKYA